MCLNLLCAERLLVSLCEVGKSHVVDVLRPLVVLRESTSPDNHVVLKRERREAGRKDNFDKFRYRRGAIPVPASAGRCNRRICRHQNIICNGEPVHSGVADRTADVEQNARRKSSDVVNDDIVQRDGKTGCGRDLHKHPAAVVKLGLNVIHDDVVNAVPPAIRRGSAIGRGRVCEYETAGNMADAALPDGDVSDQATGTNNS